MTPAAPDIGIVHRHTDDGEIYFVANTSNQPRNVQAEFRVTRLQPEIWNPMNGEVSAATIAEKSAGSTTVNLKLEPYASTIVAFTKRTLPAPKFIAWSGVEPEPMDLSSNWTVRFGTNAVPVAMDKLESWTSLPNKINFSGVATYEKTINVEPEMLQNSLSINFDFGQGTPAQERGGGQGFHAELTPPIREAAIIYINDQRVGSIWCPPYSLDVTSKLKAGENKIRIEVANLAVNYMAGIKLPNYNYAGVTETYGNRFQPQNLNLIQPLPSGLLGPVRLVATPVTMRY